MTILGDPIFAKNPDGSLKSRIGTIFFRTPGLVTQRGIHAMHFVWSTTARPIGRACFSSTVSGRSAPVGQT